MLVVVSSFQLSTAAAPQSSTVVQFSTAGADRFFAEVSPPMTKIDVPSTAAAPMKRGVPGSSGTSSFQTGGLSARSNVQTFRPTAPGFPAVPFTHAEPPACSCPLVHSIPPMA